MIIIKGFFFLLAVLVALLTLVGGGLLYLNRKQPKGSLQSEVLKKKEDLKKNFNNRTPKIISIEDYEQFYEDSTKEKEEETPIIYNRQKQGENRQKKRMQEKELKKRRKRNRIAKKSRQRNRS